MSQWTIFARDTARARVAQVDDFDRLDLGLVFNGVGQWVLSMPAESTAAALMGFAEGIIVRRDDDQFFAGPVTLMRNVWDGTRDRLVVSGPDDNVWLDRRLAYPDPANLPGAWATEHDVRTGTCETIMRQYVSFNLGPSALAARRVDGLTLAADAALGTSITGRARLQKVLDLLQGLALSGGELGFEIVQSDTDLEFRVYQPVDRTATVKFSKELGNLRSYEFIREGAKANHFVGGGGGEGVLRTFVEKADAASVADYGRIEEFRDRRDTTDTIEITQTLDEELLANKDRTGVSIAPVDTDSIAFGTHYNLGDKVTVVAAGQELQDIVREVTLTLDRNGPVITPTIGAPGQAVSTNAQETFVRSVFAQISKLHSKVANLERTR